MNAEPEALREEWLDRLSILVDSVQTWARDLGWATRRIDKALKDPELGRYEAPALLLQEEFTRALLEPLGRSAPGVEGVVDLYLMPAYDDIARLFYAEGGWRFDYLLPDAPDESSEPQPLSKESFQKILDEMKRHAATAL